MSSHFIGEVETVSKKLSEEALRKLTSSDCFFSVSCVSPGGYVSFCFLFQAKFCLLRVVGFKDLLLAECSRN